MQNSNFLLLSSIFKGYWMVDPSFAEGMQPILGNILKRIPIDGSDLQKESSEKTNKAGVNGWRIYTVGSAGIARVNTFDDAPAGSIAYLSIQGPLMRGDTYCSMGMDTMGQIIKAADRSPNISAIVLEFNTPGGTVDGTKELADTIKNASTKTYGFAHYAASAGYWLISACDEVWASSETSEFGSIGVMMSFMDFIGKWEKEGAKYHEIYSSLSQDKNALFNQVREGNYEAYIKEKLDPLAELFRAEVRANRSLQDNLMTGKMYFASQAIKNGMIDRVGTMEDLISQISNQSNSNQNSNTMSKLWDRLTGATAEEKEKVEANLEKITEERDQFETELSDVKSQLEQANKTIEAKNQKIEDLNQQLADQKDELADAKALAEKYGNKPGAMPSVPQKKGQDVPQSDAQTPVWFDADAEHNQDAAEYSNKLRK